jgi:glutathione reductase (NADPH)
VFTLPPLARTGMLEDEAREADLAFDTRFEKTADWYASRRLGETASGHKVLIERDSGKILGAHLLGWDAEEAINVFSLAIRGGIPADVLAATPFAYPTLGFDIHYMLS